MLPHVQFACLFYFGTNFSFVSNVKDDYCEVYKNILKYLKLRIFNRYEIEQFHRIDVYFSSSTDRKEFQVNKSVPCIGQIGSYNSFVDFSGFSVSTVHINWISQGI